MILTRQQAKEALSNPIIKDFADGKVLQWRRLHKKIGAVTDEHVAWQDFKFSGTEKINFDFDQYEFRIKPEPKSVFVLSRGNGSAVGQPFTDRTKAEEVMAYFTKDFGHTHGPYSLKEFREVIAE